MRFGLYQRGVSERCKSRMFMLDDSAVHEGEDSRMSE